MTAKAGECVSVMQRNVRYILKFSSSEFCFQILNSNMLTCVGDFVKKEYTINEENMVRLNYI